MKGWRRSSCFWKIFGVFAADFDALDQQPVMTKFHRLLEDGRALGIHFVITADRFGTVPSAVSSLAPGLLAFQLTNSQDYLMLDLAEVAKSVSSRSCPDAASRKTASRCRSHGSGVPTTWGSRTFSPRVSVPWKRSTSPSGPGALAPLLRLLPQSLALVEVNSFPDAWRPVLGIDDASRPSASICSRIPCFWSSGHLGAAPSTAL